ncbi:MAG: hypothetical protein Q9190_005319 [Brigantiaea leucoxantha]
MPILQPQTPPPTAPASPSNATSSDGNFVINISGDPEKDGYKEDDKNDDRGPIDPNADVKESFRGRVKTYLKSAGNLSSIRQIPQRWRREDGRPKILQRIDDHPEGYPQLAAFINSDDNFLMCRKFGFLHNRVLLYRQDELVELERDLVEMDELDKDEDPRALKSRQHDNGRDLPLTRRTLINRIDEKLKEYDESPRPRSVTPSTVPQKRALGLDDEQHVPAVSSPLNPDFAASRSRRPPPREQREKKETLKKREAKGADSTRSGTPDSQPNSRKPKKTEKPSNVLSPLRWPLPKPNLADWETPRPPTFNPILTKGDRQFHECFEQ